jgi:homoserine kinase type II
MPGMAEPSAPTVEMLWEAHDPHSALRDRFGFSEPAEAGRWVTELLGTYWGVRPGVCERVVMSDHNALAWVTTPSGRVLVKWSVVPERFSALAQIARLTTWLDGHGLPVSAPVPALDGSLQVEVDGAVSVGVQRVVEGGLLDTAVPGQVHAAGAALARLHRALASYPDAGHVVARPASGRTVAERMVSWLDSRAEHVPAADRQVLRRLVAQAPADPLPTQLVHGDFRSANVLCVADEVVAVLDFEEARLDHRVVELARSAVLLGTRFRQWGPVPEHVQATFMAGYHSVQPLTPIEERWWDLLVLWHEFAMVPPGPDPTGWTSSARKHLARLIARG